MLLVAKSPHRFPVLAFGTLQIPIGSRPTDELVAVPDEGIAMRAEPEILKPEALSADSASTPRPQICVIPGGAEPLCNRFFCGRVIALEPVAHSISLCSVRGNPAVQSGHSVLIVSRGRPRTASADMPPMRLARKVIPALPLSVAAFCGAKKCNPCLRKVLLGQGEWPVALQDTPDRDWKAPQNPSAGECVETRGYSPADDRCRIVPCYTSFDPLGRK